MSCSVKSMIWASSGGTPRVCFSRMAVIVASRLRSTLYFGLDADHRRFPKCAISLTIVPAISAALVSRLSVRV